MLRGFVNAFKIADLRRKILFALAMIAVYRLGAHVPVPGVDYSAVQAAIEGQQGGGITEMINLFTGGALTRLSVFSLGIMPYITASIIMQLLTVVVPKIDEWKKEGETGQQKITQWTRYLTILLAVLQSTGMAVIIRSGGQQLFGRQIPLMPDPSIWIVLLIILTMTAGTAFVMWLGELITDKGIGNGMSLLIFASVVSQLPSGAGRWLVGDNGGTVPFTIMMIMGLALIAGVVFMELGQRRIPVQYAKRTVGRRTYGGTETYIPLKVNQAGVIPIIFASSLLFLPNLASTMAGPTVQRFVQQYLTQDSAPFLLLYFGMTVFFAFFYTAITFNPTDVADNMKKFGGFIPGIRPGRQTAEYIDHVLTRITTAGALYLGFIATLPLLVAAGYGLTFIFGGAVLLIAVGVMLNTLQQIESQLMQRHYEGFLRS